MRRTPAAADGVAHNATLTHATPYIPAQCYTKTIDEAGHVHNPCFTCHTQSVAPNYVNDADVQTEYAFPAPARINPWSNLFVDRREAMASISDDDVRRYVRRDNYRDVEGIILARTLHTPPPAWDLDGDGRFSGYVPDAEFRFDEAGFDRKADGGYTGYRAYAYHPFPGTFFPTNGSFGDALIRLAEPFRQNDAGAFDVEVYTLNLAIVESLVTRRDVPIAATDERTIGVDLDLDGRLGVARRITFRFVARERSTMQYVGRARALLASGEVKLAAGLFPVGTELLHSVRYLDPTDEGVRMAPRMKELRYMVKVRWVSYGDAMLAAADEAREAEQSPDETRRILPTTELGIGNGAGWRLSGFIEDARGALRPQTHEEHAYCIGCHSGVGATSDSVFSFARKLPSSAFAQGWFHPTQRGLDGVAEPLREDGQPEYAYYLAENGAGDELRGNTEVIARFFDERGALDRRALARLRGDISFLLLPSAERALALDKAYMLIVREQSFVRGRDATIVPQPNVHRRFDAGEDAVSTGIVLARVEETRASVSRGARRGRR